MTSNFPFLSPRLALYYGDPLFSYIFVLYMEKLVIIIVVFRAYPCLEQMLQEFGV